MKRPREFQRKKIYDSEDECMLALWELWKYSNISDVQFYVDDIVESRWFRNRYPHVIRIRAKTLNGRKNSFGYAPNSLGVGRIAMLPHHFRKLPILHEMAHVVSSVEEAWHGRSFVRNYLQFVSRWFGRHKAEHLRTAFRRNGVKWYRRRP